MMPGLNRILMLATLTALLLSLPMAGASHGTWCVDWRAGSDDKPVNFRVGPLGEAMIFVAGVPADDEARGTFGPSFQGSVIIIDPNCPYGAATHILDAGLPVGGDGIARDELPVSGATPDFGGESHGLGAILPTTGFSVELGRWVP